MADTETLPVGKRKADQPGGVSAENGAADGDDADRAGKRRRWDSGADGVQSGADGGQKPADGGGAGISAPAAGGKKVPSVSLDALAKAKKALQVHKELKEKLKKLPQRPVPPSEKPKLPIPDVEWWGTRSSWSLISTPRRALLWKQSFWITIYVEHPVPIEPPAEPSLLTSPPPHRDALILASNQYPEEGAAVPAALKASKITMYVEHPVPIEPPAEAPPPPPQPLRLTKGEQKKLRTQRRVAREKERQEMVRQGLLEPPKAKVKMSNLMRVMAAEATQDPTKMEKEVRAAAAEREQAHVDRNLARKLTPAERREKKERKLFEETLGGGVGGGGETHVAVFKVRHLLHPQTRFKVDVNAQENRLTGCALLADSFVLVVVEGVSKSVKRYLKLMMRRIHWADAVAPGAAGEEDEGMGEGGLKKENKFAMGRGDDAERYEDEGPYEDEDEEYEGGPRDAKDEPDERDDRREVRHDDRRDRRGSREGREPRGSREFRGRRDEDEEEEGDDEEYRDDESPYGDRGAERARRPRGDRDRARGGPKDEGEGSEEDEEDEEEGGERDVDRDRHRDRDRVSRERRHSDRGRGSGDRDRDRDDREYRDRDRGHRRDRDRDYRHRDRDRDRDRRSRRRDRSRSRSRSYSRSRSRSRSRDRERRRRASGFDMGPGPSLASVPGLAGLLSGAGGAAPAAAPAPAAPAPAAAPSVGTLPLTGVAGAMAAGFAGLPGMQAVPGSMFPNMFPFAATAAQGGMPTQATRHARRVYVGGLPPMANEQSVAAFFNNAMALVNGNTAGPGDCVVYVYINQEKKFAFVEMRTVEEASNAMALDGINFEGVSVRVRRPSDYNPSMAATLGPTQPSPNLNLAAVGLTAGGSGGADGPDRIFVGGLPYYLTEEQIRELLSSFGPLRAFDLVKDRDTGNSKGYGFCVYQDPSVTDIACMALNGMKMGDKTLTVRRATASGQAKPEQANVLAQAQQQIALSRMALTGANTVGLGAAAALPGTPVDIPTKVICLSQVVSPDELTNDEDYDEIMEDMREECAKYGSLVNVVIPRPPAAGTAAPGVGMVFVEYGDTAGALKAKAALHGRKFGGNAVVAIFYPEDAYARADYSKF
ncbi:unnamed protein product [Closterium sp. Naga37s-1]|nr:unnamed protein product [Closterium sp. Naga37s-1]